MIVKLNKINRKKIIAKAVRVLENGGIIMYASDTSYGLAVDYSNKTAIQSLDMLKKRDKPFYSINFSNFDQISEFYALKDFQADVLYRYLPGEFTFVIMSNKPACRVPKGSIITDIVEKLGRPVTATSANHTGDVPAFQVSDLDPEFIKKIDLVIDESKLAETLPSTIIDISKEKPRVLRQGKAKFEL